MKINNIYFCQSLPSLFDDIKKEFDSPIQKILNKQIYLTQKHRLNKLERIILKIKLFF
jgi:hypothetical protein